MAAANVARKAVQLQVRNGCAILRMVKGENKWNGMFTHDFRTTLDQVERNPEVNFLIITGEGKFFSYGLDLPWIASQPFDVNAKFFAESEGILQRILTFPMPTIAALNGHAFGNGAILALTCDYRVMKKGRGWFCLPETKIRLKFSYPTLEIIKLKLGRGQTLRDSAIFSKRYGAEEAVRAEIADAAVDETELIDAAIKLGQDIAGDGLDRDVVAAVKDKLYGAPFREQKASQEKSMTQEEKLERLRAFVRGAQILSSKM
ncbi:uncharacterized protein [Diadema antillarum]|uniref:uncharacterized protein n=1 Tax=Diadema antillarum TaxID=105358 RepID=UPI003A84F1B1